MPIAGAVDSVLERYKLPAWVKPYVYKYARENPLSAVKFAISLVDVKRRKGEDTKTHVRLPNGTQFDMETILKVLSLFFYGEEEIARIERLWAEKAIDRNAEYEKRFISMSETDLKRARAIRNLAEGLGHTVGDKPKIIEKTFDRISRIDEWNDRIVTTGLILRYSYAATFGIVFYRVFYPVSPEFMRSFVKAFDSKDRDEGWDSEEAKRIIEGSLIDHDHLIELTRNVLADVLRSIEGNMALAKEMKLEKEVMLLAEISVAYPFQRLSEMGVKVDVEKEVKLVKKMAR